MFSNLCKTRIFLSLLCTLFISAITFAQAVQTNNNDDQEDEEDFIVVGTPGLKPDTGQLHPLCARPDEGPFSLWIEVRMANMDDIDLPCPLVVKASLSVQGQEEPTLDIYSNPLEFTCTEEGFCKACPNTPLCRTYAIFDIPPSSFYGLCSNSFGEKIEIDITASLSYGCENEGQTSYYGLMDLETPGCNGYLPEACFNVNTTGSIRGEGCLVCPELREETPDTIRVTSGMGKPTNTQANNTQLEASLDYSFHNASNLVNNELILYSQKTNQLAASKWTIINSKGQIIGRGIDQDGEIRYPTYHLEPGYYFIQLTSDTQSVTIPWLKI